jgi:proteasome lid subunit RPN8/RPN11
MFGWLQRLFAWWRPADRNANQPPGEPVPIERIVLTEGVANTLFAEYAEHRRSERGGEEIGWVLLGLRHGGDAIALAALPAGADRDAGAAHVRFNSEAQALASRIVRQENKRLQIIGVVHTHPGSLRTPSDGDLLGDRAWVAQLRGGEGVFAIGTADAKPTDAGPTLQVRGELCFHWYVLGAADTSYRRLAVDTITGADLANIVHPVWSVIEEHAEPLNRLCRQLASVEFSVIGIGGEWALGVQIALADPNQQLRLLLNGSEVRYYWERGGELIAIDPHAPQLDRAVYLVLADLAQEAASSKDAFAQP